MLSEIANINEKEAIELLDKIAAERKTGTRPVVNAQAYLKSAGITEDKLTGSYTTKAGTKVVVIVKSTNPHATLAVGKSPTQEEQKAADEAAEHVPIVKLTKPDAKEDDPESELPEDV
jgi:hypothetical protein